MDLDLILEIVLTIVAVVGWVLRHKGKTLLRELRDLFELAEDSEASEDQKVVAKSVIREKLK